MNLEPGSFGGLARVEEDLFRELLAGMEGLGVEIGCCDGCSTRVILEASKLHLTSYDPMVPDSMEVNLVGSVERLHKNLHGFGDRWTFIKDASPPPFYPLNQPLSFVFIDGDHTYEAVLKDFHFWTPKLKPGGILAMHDSRMNRGGAQFHKGPSRVADELVFGNPEKWQIIGEAFSLTVARLRII